MFSIPIDKRQILKKQDIIRNKIKTLMVYHNLLKKEMARRLKVSPNTVINWLEQHHKINLKGVIKISKTFNVSIPWLLGEKIKEENLQEKEKIIEDFLRKDRKYNRGILQGTRKQKTEWIKTKKIFEAGKIEYKKRR